LLRPVSAGLSHDVRGLTAVTTWPAESASSDAATIRRPLLKVLGILEERFYGRKDGITLRDIRQFWYTGEREPQYTIKDIRTSLRLLEQLGILSKSLNGAGYSFMYSPYKKLNGLERNSLKRKLASVRKDDGILFDNAGYGRYVARQLNLSFNLFASDSKEEFMFNVLCSIICDGERLDRFARMFVNTRNEFELNNIVEFGRDSPGGISMLLTLYIFNNFDREDDIVEGMAGLTQMSAKEGLGIKAFLLRHMLADVNSKNANEMSRRGILVMKRVEASV
jgi:hypothetical protein